MVFPPVCKYAHVRGGCNCVHACGGQRLTCRGLVQFLVALHLLSVNPELVTSVSLARRLGPGIPALGPHIHPGIHADFRGQNSDFTLQQRVLFITVASVLEKKKYIIRVRSSDFLRNTCFQFSNKIS